IDQSPLHTGVRRNSIHNCIIGWIRIFLEAVEFIDIELLGSEPEVVHIAVDPFRVLPEVDVVTALLQVNQGVRKRFIGSHNQHSSTTLVAYPTNNSIVVSNDS